MLLPHRRLLAVVALAVFGAFAQFSSPVPAAEGDLAPDLALIPADAAGFVHVRVADLYKSEHFRELRQLLGKAGEDALRAFNSRFVPAPSSVDRVTVYFLAPKPGTHDDPEAIAIIATSAPFDRAGLVKTFATGPVKDEGNNIVADERGTTAIFTPSNRTVAIGSPAVIRRLAKEPKHGTGPLTPALKLAGGGKPFVAVLNPTFIPEEAFQHAPPQIQPFLPMFRAKLVTLTAEFTQGTHLDLRMTYPDADAAGQAEQAVRGGLNMLRQFLGQGREEMKRRLTDPNAPTPESIEKLPEAAEALLGLAALNQVDEVIQNLPLRKEGSDLRLDVTLPRGPLTVAAAGSVVSVGLLLPAVQKVREAAARAKDQNNLKQIALAMHNYHSVNNTFPPHAIYSKDGKPLLSWRVAILPYIEQDNLYRQFKLDEPWDSPNNKRLIAQMPQIYLVPNSRPTKEPGMTFYQVFVGKDAGFERREKGTSLPDVTDGTSNTILVAEGADPVIWTKPDDLTFDAAKPLPKLGGHYPGGFNVAFMDGSVRFLRQTIDPQTLRALITRNGGEVVNGDGF
jgi:prepilin-type processing-associated H-X9-DG protein